MGTGSALKVASLKACKHVSNVAEDSQARSTWLGRDEMEEQETIPIVICYFRCPSLAKSLFSMHLPNEIIVFEPTVCLPMVQDSPEIDARLPRKPQDRVERSQHGPSCGNYWSEEVPKTDHESSKVAKAAQEDPRRSQDGPRVAPRWPKGAPRWPKRTPRWPKRDPRWPAQAPR